MIDFIVNIALPVLAGFIGIFMHSMQLVINRDTLAKKQSWAMFTQYLSNNILTLIYSIFSYVLVLLIWYFEGLEFIGMVKGKLTYMTVGLGFLSQSILDKVVYNSKLGQSTPNPTQPEPVQQDVELNQNNQ